MSASPQALAVPGAAGTIHRDGPSWNGLRTAALGGFSCEDAASGRALLDKAADLLRAEGFQALVGPMDGDTWHRYRLVCESDGSPPFAMEPVSAAHDLAAFRAAGFSAISDYVSARARLADAVGSETASMPGIRVTAWDGRDAAGFVDRLFEMSAASFAGNRFFKPIERSAFLELYEPVLPLVDPRFVLFAHGPDDRLVGFLFGLPDRLEGAAPRTAILKTYASGVRGVGHVLADSFHRRALDLGYDTVIHALMHVDNVSCQRSSRYGAEVFRRYALMGRPL